MPLGDAAPALPAFFGRVAGLAALAACFVGFEPRERTGPVLRIDRDERVHS